MLHSHAYTYTNTSAHAHTIVRAPLAHVGIKIPRIEHGRIITMVCLAVHVLIFVPFGKLTDCVGNYRRVMLVAAVLLLISAVPMILLLNLGGVDCDIAQTTTLQPYNYTNTTAQSDDQGVCAIISGDYRCAWVCGEYGR